MTDQPSKRPYFGAAPDDELEHYHALSGLAVAALVISVFSAIALIDPRATVIGAVGVLVALAALWRIARRSPALVGRKVAMAGLFLSLLFSSIALGNTCVSRWLLTRQAREFSMGWFELLAEGQPQAAHYYLFAPEERLAPDNDLWKFYCSNYKYYQALKQFLDREDVRALVALGKKATVRPYAVEEISTVGGHPRVVALYAVTFDDNGRKTTFLVRLVARRVPAEGDYGKSQWQVVGLEGGVHPSWEEEPGFAQ